MRLTAKVFLLHCTMWGFFNEKILVGPKEKFFHEYLCGTNPWYIFYLIIQSLKTLEKKVSAKK